MDLERLVEERLELVAGCVVEVEGPRVVAGRVAERVPGRAVPPPWSMTSVTVPTYSQLSSVEIARTSESGASA